MTALGNALRGTAALLPDSQHDLAARVPVRDLRQRLARLVQRQHLDLGAQLPVSTRRRSASRRCRSTWAANASPVMPRSSLAGGLFFTADPARYLIVNWLDEASQLVGQLRAHLAQHPGDPRAPELVTALAAASPKFDELWQEHGTARFRSYRKG